MSYNANNEATGSFCIPAVGGAGASPPPPTGFPPIPQSPDLPERSARFSIPTQPVYGYSPKGELLSMTISGLVLEGSDLVVSYTRAHTADYDELGRMITSAIDSDEWGGLTRGFTYTYSYTTGEFERTGSDGVKTYIALDAADRVAFVRRGPAVNPVMSAQYAYLHDGLLWSVTYGNGNRTVYDYDTVNRVSSIDHQDLMGSTMRKLEYGYTDNNLVAAITESDVVGPLATVTFGYDARGRLTSEVRTGESVYNLKYEYDQGGNRTKKTKTISLFPLNKIEDRYYYDVRPEEPDPANPNEYSSFNNRLMFYETWRIRTEAGQSQSSSGGTILELGGGGMLLEPGGGGAMQAAGPGGEIVETLLSTTYYYYNDQGNVTRVVTEKEDTPPWESRFEATQMVYARNGRAVTYGLAETWDDFTGGQFINHVVSSIHEYRYDGPRQRYLKRELNPENPLGELSSLWTDYDGNQPYGDFTVSGGVPTEVRSIELGLAKVEPWRSAGGAYTQYYHTDMIGTTRHMTNASGDETGAAVYTAFGERMSGSMGGPGDRYGYAGSWGYQEDQNFPFLHVGARYYDPAIGRFVQRDPIGIRGGLNVYQYVEGAPTMSVDPSGLGKKWDWIKKKAKEAWKVIKKLPPYVLPGPPIPIDAAPDIAEAYTRDAKRRHLVEDHDDGTEDPKCPTCKRLTPKKRRRKGPPIIDCGAHGS